jgi:flagellar hook-associated protein 1 FlgK
MSGINSALDIALSGLNYFETGINTVSENLANETTAGYAAETASATTAIGDASEGGIGVNPATVSRATNNFATNLLNAATSSAQATSTQATALAAISGALQNNGDVQTAINQFFTDFSTLASQPTSSGQRETVLSDLETVAASFQSAAGSITTTQEQAGSTLSTDVTQANGLLTQLATINKGLAATPNDPNLLDQQQAALNSLSGLLSFNVLPQANGQVFLTTGGTVLLDQSGAQTLTLTPGSGATPPSVTAGAANTPVNIQSQDGAIGANISTYQSGVQALQSLNTLATLFAQSVNSGQAQGLTQSGAQGTPLVTVPSPTATAASTNTGTAALTAQVTNSSALPTDGGPFLLSYNASAGWTAVNQTSGQSYTAGQGNPLAFAGLTVAVTGVPASGDQFVVNPAPAAASQIAVATNDPDAIAAADPYVASPGTLQASGAILNNNAGTITAGVDSVTSTPATGAAVIPAAYYGQSLQVTFTSSTAYTVATSANPTVSIATGSLTNANGNIAVAYPAGAASGSYWQLPIGGSPAAGDSLTLTPGGSNSGSNAERVGASWTASGTTADGSLQSSFIGFTTSLGANAQQAQAQATTAATQVTTATNNLQTVSGVSPDQQAVILTTYQQAYQAAAQVISTAHAMFESLLQAI